ncbi:MAG: VPS10 domain-containing protein [Candidatus Aminicenantales bacterium]
MKHRHSIRAFRLIFGLVFAALVTSTAVAQARKPQRIPATDPQIRIQGYEAYARMIPNSKFKGLSWQWIGPKNVSGRVIDVDVVAPKGRNYTAYAATASGGLWKTENEGTTWEPVFDKGPSVAIGDVAVAPSDPRIVWIGTGEANIFRSSQAGIGVYKSADAGKTWTHRGLEKTSTIARIVVHPENPDVVYVAASGREWTDNPDRGVYKTTDGGATWTKALYVDAQTGAIDLVMDPSSPETLYASLWQRIRRKWNDPRNTPASSGSGIYKTTDGGKTWKPANAGLPEARFRGRIGIDLCRTKPGVLYALVDNYEIARQPTKEELGDSYGIPSAGFIKGATVFRSDNGGDSWVQTSGLIPEQKTFMERHSNTYGWVFGQVRVDPNDPDTVYTMGLMLNVSKDGGKTFARVAGPGVDHHALWIDPANSSYMIKGFDQGAAVSYDRGKNWRNFRDLLPVCQFFNLNYDLGSPFRVYGSMQDHGSFRGIVDLSRGRDKIPAVDFEGAPGGEGSNHAVDPENPNIVYSAGFYGTISRTDLGMADRRLATKELMPAVYPGEPRLRGQWLAPFILSPHSPEILYLGLQYVFRSTNRGDTWEHISPDLTRNDPSEMGDIPYQTLFSLAESPLMPGLLYAGTDDGRTWVTRDGGKGWQEITAGLAAGKWVSRIVASAGDLGTVYLTQNGKRDDDFTSYAWKSTDFGKTWVDISKGIPCGPINVIREDPVDRNILYLGTDGGVFVSTDAGITWEVLGGNLPTVYVHDLVIHPRENIIVIATHGRGMWALDADAVNRRNERRRRYDEEE